MQIYFEIYLKFYLKIIPFFFCAPFGKKMEVTSPSFLVTNDKCGDYDRKHLQTYPFLLVF